MCFGGGGGSSSATPQLAPINIPTPTGDPSQATGAMPSAPDLYSAGPAPYQSFGNIPTVSAATTSAPTIDPNSALNSGLTMGEQANEQALQPLFQSQDMSLSDNLASRGIVNSGAATYLNDQLSGQQASALAGANAPLIQGASSAYDTDILANQQAQLGTGQFNANAQNNASGLNAGYYNEAVTGNENNFNNYENQLETQGTTYGEGLLEGYLGSYGGANPTTLGSIAGSPGAVGAAYNQGTANTPNYGGAFSSAFSSLGGGSGGGAGGGGGGGGSSVDPGIFAAEGDDPELAAAGF